MKKMILIIERGVIALLDVVFIPLLFVISIISRGVKRKFDVGLGPDPLINNVYIKKALQRAGYTAETYVIETNYITNDYDRIFCKIKLPRFLKFLFLTVGIYIYTIFTYRCIYIYFDGAPLSTALLGRRWFLLSRLEPFLYHLAGIKIVALAYGGDVFTFDKCNSLFYRYLMNQEYPVVYLQQKMVCLNIRKWCKHADFVVNGADNVYYIPFCGDMLAMNYLCIDTEEYKEIPYEKGRKGLVITHVVNHRDIKGSRFFEEAIKELIDEGLDIEFINLSKVSGEIARQAMEKADIVADQLILGAYGMTAIQSMAMGKPVLCYIDPKIEELMIIANVMDKDELPIVNCNIYNVKDTIRELYYDREKLSQIGCNSRLYVEKYHSISSGAERFGAVNRRIGL